MSMDGQKPHLLPLSLSSATKKIRDDVPLVCGWALINAFSIVFATAVGYIADHYIHLSCSQSSFILPCFELTGAAEAWLTALSIGMLCCAPTQAAVAALALLLPCRRRWRRALAYLALAVTVLFHCMYVSAVCIFLAADPGYIFGRIYYTVIFCFIVVGDLLCFRALLGGDGWGMQYVDQLIRDTDESAVLGNNV